MKKTIKFCFKIDKKLGLAIDENGQLQEAYVCCSFDTKKKLSEKQKEKAHKVFQYAMARKFGIDSQYITPISEKEYNDNTK